MEIGDLAIESAPEGMGLAWTGKMFCLHIETDDAKVPKPTDAAETALIHCLERRGGKTCNCVVKL